MKSNLFKRFLLGLAVMALSCGQAFAGAKDVEYLTFKPLTETLKGVQLKPVKEGKWKVPLITWPGDTATISTDMDGTFKAEGLDVELFVENDFAKQVEGVLKGDTPILRCTVGMCNSAAEVFKNAGTNLYLIYQLTWSNGGDVLVARPGINSLVDLKGKTIGLQLYGPHMDYLTTALAKVGLKPTDVKIKWLKELTIPTYDTKGKVVDPRTAFEQDPELDAVMVISPDAAALTSDGAESVKGKTVVTSAAFNRVIGDFYAVRADWFDKHRAEAQKLVHALMLGQEHFDALMAKKAGDPKYTQLINKSAELLYGTTGAAADEEASLADCQWVGFSGNVAFFNAAGTTRNFNTLSDEVQTAFKQLGLLKGAAPLKNPGWDYAQLAAGLTKADVTGLASAGKPKFDKAKVQAKVEKEISVELATYEEASALPPFEIYFKPDQSEFAAADYLADFKQVLDQSQTASGMVFVIEGNVSTDGYNKKKREGASAGELDELKQVAKNISKKRADAVKTAILTFCSNEGVTCDESQFVTIGRGIESPKFPVVKSREQWEQNRRVVFRPKFVTDVNVELDEYVPGQ